MKTHNLWTIAGLIIVPFTFVFMIALLWFLDFFEFSGTDASAKIVGTALTLGGGLVATMVTLIGLILKQSVDQRNADLKKEAERRLQLEAAIRAVHLLGTDAGGESSETQRIGALFSLAHLGLVGLAISLVSFMRPNDLIEASPTSSLLDMALRSHDTVVQRQAATFLRDHPDKLFEDEWLDWPEYISFSWPQELSYLTRQYAIKGLMKAILSRPRSEWARPSLNATVVFLITAFQAEEDLRLKSNIALFLQEVLKIFSENELLRLPDKDMKIENIRMNVADTVMADADIGTRLLVDNLRYWLDDQIEIGQVDTDP